MDEVGEFQPNTKHKRVISFIAVGCFVVFVGVGGFFLGRTSGSGSESNTLLGITLAQLFHLEKEKPVLEIPLVTSRDVSTSTAQKEKGSSKSAPTFSPETQITNVSKSALSLKSSEGKKFEPTPSTGSSSGISVSQSPNASREISKSEPIVATPCSFQPAGNPTHAAVLNEVAWMGTSDSSNDEWVEVKNISANTISFNGWHVLDESGSIDITLDVQTVAARSFLILERTDDDSAKSISADAIYTGALSNSGAHLELLDPQCRLIDEVDARSGWPAGENESKKTMERDVTGFGWHTSAVSGGTPKAENSVGMTFPDDAENVSSQQQSSYHISVSMVGDGRGHVTSDPSGISCDLDCSESYPAGTSVSFTATPENESSFEGWSGACSGSGGCTMIVTSSVGITAWFRSIALPSPPPPLPPPPVSSKDVLISEIQAGTDASGDDEFIELYNPGDSAIDLTGWSLKKKTSGGSESSFVVASRFEGKTIPAHGYFLLAHDGGYAGAVTPDVTWPSSYSLAYTNNAIVLYGADGVLVQEVSWVEIPKNESYERDSWIISTFHMNQLPSPQNSH